MNLFLITVDDFNKSGTFRLIFRFYIYRVIYYMIKGES